MLSKEALIFQNRVKAFNEDLEIIDILKIALKNDDLLKDDCKLFKYIDDEKHINLCSRKSTEQSRIIILNHLRNTVYSAYIKDLYEELTGYLRALLFEAAKVSKNKNKAKRLLGEHTISIKASDILQFNSLEDLASFIADEIIQSLENERSTKDLIKKVCNKIDLRIDNSIIDEAIPFLEVRHKLVHTNGYIDEDFRKKYTKIDCDSEGYIVLNYQLVKTARDKISELVNAIDGKAVLKGILSPNAHNS